MSQLLPSIKNEDAFRAFSHHFSKQRGMKSWRSRKNTCVTIKINGIHNLEDVRIIDFRDGIFHYCCGNGPHLKFTGAFRLENIFSLVIEGGI